MPFRLISGVFISDTSALKKEYRCESRTLKLSLSSDDYGRFFPAAVKKLTEPVFFFLEIPGDNDRMLTYYLDNCTSPVAQAILKRYGGILYNDGVIRWGFGSHKTDDEIYMQEYQTLQIYSKNPQPYEKLLQDIGYVKNEKAVLAWSVLSESNVGECVNVESDGETYVDMVNNLIDAGMYPAK